MQNYGREHELVQRALVEGLKQQVSGLVRTGMTAEEVGAALAPLTAAVGKQAAKSLRRLAREVAGLPAPAIERELIVSKRGTLGYRVRGNRAIALTAEECSARGHQPGPGNLSNRC